MELISMDKESFIQIPILNMKQFIWIILLIVSIAKLSAQDISIKLSIYWDKPIFKSFIEYDTIDHPYLRITYQNNTNKSVYLYDIFDGNIGIMRFPWAGSRSIFDMEKAASLHLNFTGEDYTIHSYMGWEAISDSTLASTEEEYEMSIINSSLADIYQYIYEKNNLKSINPDTITILDRKASHYTREGIINYTKNQFIFLKPGEQFSKKYDLIGLMMVKGNFTFIMEKKKFPSYIETDLKLGEGEKNTITYFPNKINGYKLYHGKFDINELKIEFK